MRQRRGFSLIELLVVIAIIAVLAGILFPVFSIARGKARRTRCLSHMEQIGQALKMYASDHNGFLPSYSQSHPSWANALTPAQKNTPQPGLVVTWDVSIESHLKSKDILLCPDNPFGRDKRAFAMTAYCMRQRTSPVPGYPYFLGDRVENIANQSSVVMLFEKGKNLPGSWGDAMGENVRQSHASNDQSDYSAELFHSKGKNFLYMDGHVKWSKEGTGPFMNQPGGAAPPGQTAEPGQCYLPDRKAAGGDWPDPS
jgi:prepilin-type N-terminal cleavage/methylation domain-containing protein/prepilin-type processing-associated H-X9-DG protein